MLDRDEERKKVRRREREKGCETAMDEKVIG
jgi:hypothetical protein